MSGLARVERPLPGIALVTLDRPQAMNALDRMLRADLVVALDTLAADPDCTVIVITGAGRAFCAGLDLKDVARDASLLEPTPALDPVAALLRCPQPVIAYVNGPAITGGFELALACDIRLAGPSCRFADTHARVGAMPGWGLSQRLSRMIGIGRAMELSLTGRFVDAAEAVELGLVSRVAKHGLEDAIALAAEICGTVPGMPARLKRVMAQGHDRALGDALAFEACEALEFNGSVSAVEIDGRRDGVIAAGRASAHSRETG